ncbi:hypothetical protein PybrP1_008873 [[Pythium] brassicae (nom. inval.)]|nr:hypothetical protein PybrP1_008873 [[Pythium] brassicae (nom. inval.)]
MAVALALWLLPIALLLLLLLLLGVNLSKRRQRAREGDDSDSDSNSSDDDDNSADNARQAVEAPGDAREETISLIVAQRRRRRQAARLNRHGVDEESDKEGGAEGGAFASLRALLPWGSSSASGDAHSRLPPLAFMRATPVPAKAPKRFHQPHFFPLLEETARWWAAQCEGDQAASETRAGATSESHAESALLVA